MQRAINGAGEFARAFWLSCERIEWLLTDPRFVFGDGQHADSIRRVVTVKELLDQNDARPMLNQRVASVNGFVGGID